MFRITPFVCILGEVNISYIFCFIFRDLLPFSEEAKFQLEHSCGLFFTCKLIHFNKEASKWTIWGFFPSWTQSICFFKLYWVYFSYNRVSSDSYVKIFYWFRTLVLFRFFMDWINAVFQINYFSNFFVVK